MASGAPKHFGRMDNPDGSASIKGSCGDEMEFYFIARDDVLDRVAFHTDGSAHARLCGETTACLVEGRTIDEALEISPERILEEMGDVSEDQIHCTILAAMTLLKALGDYVFRKSI